MSTATLTLKEKFIEALHAVENSEKVCLEAKEHLSQLEFPTTRDENWKYSKVTPHLKHDFVLDKDFSDVNFDIEKYIVKDLDAYVLVFINGCFLPDKSTLPKSERGITVGSLAQIRKENPTFFEWNFGSLAQDEGHIFTAINTAYAIDGTVVHLTDGVELDKPIHIIYLNQGNSIVSQSRNLIVAGRNSYAKIIVTYETDGNNKALTNVVSEILLRENSSLEISKIQYENDETCHISTEQIKQESNSRFTLNTITLNGGFVRNNVNVELAGSNCESNLFGLYLLKGEQHVDNHTLIDHQMPHCLSNELYKGIMDDKSTGVFNGKVYVRRDAQKTNAFQNNSNILLSDDATINSKPELEIYADDVKCSHGSTTGQMDKNAIFYFRSRGVSEETAKNMLMYAFASDVIDNISITPLKEKINLFLDNKFNKF